MYNKRDPRAHRGKRQIIVLPATDMDIERMYSDLLMYSDLPVESNIINDQHTIRDYFINIENIVGALLPEWSGATMGEKD